MFLCACAKLACVHSKRNPPRDSSVLVDPLGCGPRPKPRCGRKPYAGCPDRGLPCEYGKPQSPGPFGGMPASLAHLLHGLLREPHQGAPSSTPSRQPRPHRGRGPDVPQESEMPDARRGEILRRALAKVTRDGATKINGTRSRFSMRRTIKLCIYDQITAMSYDNSKENPLHRGDLNLDRVLLASTDYHMQPT